MPFFFNPLSSTLDYYKAGVDTLAAVGSTPAAAGASISGTTLTLQPASATLPGVITAGAQTIGGVKTLTSPILVTPALGTPASGVMTNVTGTAAGLTAGNVTTNANLTGPITSTGNATAVAAQTGSGSVFAMQDSPSLTTPALGTPSALVGTNISGTAAGLTAGNVTTNANLTGDVTSVGNATTLTNAPVIAKVLTGYTSGAGTVSATDSILQAIQKLNGNDSTNANLTGPITSVGNATALAAQTGTGTTFVVQNTPTLTTPNIGAATGTSLDASGAVSAGGTITGSSPNYPNLSLTSTSTNITAMRFANTNSARVWYFGETGGEYQSAGGFLIGRDGFDGTVFMDSDGKVGISNTAPGVALDVTGAIRASTQITSSVATGTAPLVVSSTTQVPNLYVARAVVADSATVNANLTGDVTSVGNATTLTNAPVIAKVLTGYSSGAGTVASTDSILQAIQKLNGNDATNANLTGVVTSVGNATSFAASPTFTGTVTIPTPFTLGAVSTTATGTQINYLNAATGTTGTTSTNVVFSTSPTLTTPALGTPSAIVLTNATGLTGAAFGTQTARTFLQGPASGSAANPTFAVLTPPTVQRVTATGAGTYTTPTSPVPLWIRVQMVGGGGGGGPTGPSSGAATDGTSTTFVSGGNTNTAGPGIKGIGSTGGGGAGGAATLTWGTLVNSAGGGGGQGSANLVNSQGGNGGSSFFGGAGNGSQIDVAGVAAAANTGSGGGAGGGAATIQGGGGGGSGAYLEFIVANPTTSYTYVNGTKGNGGTLGTGGRAGGNGADGVIVVTEYYQ